MVVDDGADIELARGMHRDDPLGQHAGVLERDHVAAHADDGVDDRIAEFTAQGVAALAADAQDLDRLSRRLQLSRPTAHLARDVGVESAAQAAIRRDRNQEMHVILARSHQQRRRARAFRQAGGESGNHPFHALGIGSGAFGRDLGSAQLRRGDHLHGRRDLLRRRDAVDANPEVFQVGHEPLAPLPPSLGHPMKSSSRSDRDTPSVSRSCPRSDPFRCESRPGGPGRWPARPPTTPPRTA